MNQHIINQHMQDTWYILGAGAIGCLWACNLKKAGFSVQLISRKPCSQTTLTLHKESAHCSFTVDYTTAEQLNETIHYLLVSTKAQHTVDAINSIKHHLSEHARVLILQNGLASEQLAGQLPHCKLFAASTTDGAFRTDNHTVVHAGFGRTVIGAANQTTQLSDCEKLLQYLPVKYLHIDISCDIRQQQWKKLALNCIVNGLTAIHQCRNGELLSIDSAHQQLKELCEETFHIIAAQDFVLFENVQSLYDEVVLACTITASNYSSMYQDIKHKRPTEIDYINGYLCDQADKMSIHCEKNRDIVKRIKHLEQIK